MADTISDDQRWFILEKTNTLLRQRFGMSQLNALRAMDMTEFTLMGCTVDTLHRCSLILSIYRQLNDIYNKDIHEINAALRTKEIFVGNFGGGVMPFTYLKALSSPVADDLKELHTQLMFETFK